MWQLWCARALHHVFIAKSHVLSRIVMLLFAKITWIKLVHVGYTPQMFDRFLSINLIETLRFYCKFSQCFLLTCTNLILCTLNVLVHQKTILNLFLMRFTYNLYPYLPCGGANQYYCKGSIRL